MGAEGLTVATWNTRKSDLSPVLAFIDEAQPDVLVLTESRRLSNQDLDAMGATGATWRGDHTDAGVGIYTFNDYGLATADGVWSTPQGTETDRARTERLRRWTLGAQVVGPHPFFLLAVWAHNEWAFRPVNAAISDYAEQLNLGRAIVAGDFNNGCRWDGITGNKKDHRHTADLLDRCGLVSAYHRSRNIQEDVTCQETDKTFWSGFDSAKSDHIDFIYAPAGWIDSDPGSVSVGSWADYASPGNRVSDHSPVSARLTPR